VVIDSHGQWQHVDWDGDEYTIDPSDERVINELVSNDIKIMLVLDIWFSASRTVFLETEEDIATYTSWVRFMVRHFKGRIDYYEILNEPFLGFENMSDMSADGYVNLIKATVPVIREEDPDAKIVIGAVPYTLLNHCREWMWDLLNSDVMSLVDGFSWHGMYGAAPSDDPRGRSDLGTPKMIDYWENYPAFVDEIKTVAAANGFEGEFMTEEMIWRTPAYDISPAEVADYTDTAAAKYFARAIIIHLGLDVAPGLAVVPGDYMPVSYSVIQALATIMAGAEPAELPLTIESEASNIKTYGFTLSNGDKLLAIWTDGAAVDDDPGVPVTLTFPGFSAERVTGFDVLNRFEQQIIMEDGSENLVIHGLLVKDYPILIKFSNVELVDIPENSLLITPTTESLPGLSFTGTWLGSDPVDDSTISVILTQIGRQLEGTFSDTFSEQSDGTLIQPGFSGRGSGYLVSTNEANMVFNLKRSDGASIQLDMRLTISLQDSTLTLEIPQLPPYVLHSQE